MTNITYYSINEAFKTVEHGNVTKGQALEIIDTYSSVQVGLKGSAEEVVSKSLFGFSLDAHRFIEIAMETESRYRVKLEMPLSKRVLFIPISTTYQREITIKGLGQLHDIISQFFTMSLDDFKRYFEGQQ